MLIAIKYVAVSAPTQVVINDQHAGEPDPGANGNEMPTCSVTDCRHFQPTAPWTSTSWCAMRSCTRTTGGTLGCCCGGADMFS